METMKYHTYIDLYNTHVYIYICAYIIVLQQQATFQFGRIEMMNERELDLTSIYKHGKRFCRRLLLWLVWLGSLHASSNPLVLLVGDKVHLLTNGIRMANSGIMHHHRQMNVSDFLKHHFSRKQICWEGACNDKFHRTARVDGVLSPVRL